MSRHDDYVTLRQMLDQARTAVRIASGKTAEEIAGDELLGPALVRYLEVVGEAATRVSSEARARFVAIPWREVIGLRNRLIHGYDIIDFDVLRQIVDDDLPPLIAGIEAILADRK